MIKDRKLPTPWRDPSSGTYYLNLRVPGDLLTHFQKKHIQKSLRTKDRREADRKLCEEYLILQRQFDKIRRERTQGSKLTEPLIPHLLDEWLHASLRDDEEDRLLGRIDRTNPDSFEALTDLMEDLERGQRTGRHPDFLLREAAAILKRKNIGYEIESLAFIKLVEALSVAFVRLLDAQCSRDQGKKVMTTDAPTPVFLVSELYSKFKAHRTGEKLWKDPETQDRREYGPIVREFIKVVGDKPAHNLTQADTQKYYEHTMARDDISLGTKKRNFTRIKSVLLYGRDKHQLPNVTGPLEISTTYKKTHNSYERFSREDLEALFHSEQYKSGGFKKSALFWLPLLGLYTGARVDEVASLLVSEVEEKAGVWCYYMSSKEANGGGKNEFAPRWVPIHSQVLKAGFLDYWRLIKTEGHKRLFPELGNAARDGCSKRATVDFTEYRRSVGVGAITERSTKTFHSFRSTLVSELKERGVDGDMRRSLVGHSKGKGDAHDTIYDQATFDPVKARDALEMASFGLRHPTFVDAGEMRKARLRYLAKK